MVITRRALCASAVLAGLASLTGAASAEEAITVIDLAGRTVHLPARPKRIVLFEGRDLVTMSLLHSDPASIVAGWAAVDRIDSEILQKRLLNGHSISAVGKQTPDTLSLEGLIGLAPDLVVTNAFMTPQGANDPLLQQFQELGIPVVFSDASSNAQKEIAPTDPVGDLRVAMRMWGTLLGAQAKAESFLAFFDRQLADITAHLKGAEPVTTYFEVQSTVDDCCWAAGRKVWGDLLAIAGGQPLPEVKAPWFQKLSLEYLLAAPHEVYIASGGGWSSGSRPAIGPGIDQKKGSESLKRLIEARPGFDHLASVRDRRVHGIWTGLITNAPLNIVFVAIAAKWLHPQRGADIDPARILETINREFAAFPIEGPLWASI
ncbi:ABC-type transporter, periplasmic subunit [Rhizobium sp. CF080]|uniref:ABC transporter substrate-binding protein n=1 Tax=Rhizobium sp. (strain CF080) TaxID=1144310 RepID=UPI000271CDCD|nr:ABC transporter substrate-binding protein [Rhizobium sp. CF080]EUB99229.1 ABC-type transporter, periplasmic subunit [Rhizobium sp. CF080]